MEEEEKNEKMDGKVNRKEKTPRNRVRVEEEGKRRTHSDFGEYMVVIK